MNAEANGSVLLIDIGELTTNDPDRGGLLGIVHDAAVAAVDGRIEWVGHADDLPSEYRDLRTLDCEGRAVVPGFVDAHTHAVFAGERAGEFVDRMAGATYEELLASGGGIYSTVSSTRSASFVDLIGASLPRFQRMAAAGTTTAEVKTGYGLDVATEAAMVAAIRAIDMALPIELVPTFLGAHVVAPEFAGDTSGYLDLVTGDMLDTVVGDVAFVDVFCDPAAFSPDDAARVLTAAREAGLSARIHADQTGRVGAAALAAEFEAASADHLDHASDADLAAMAEAGTSAVLLPSVSYCMRTAPPDGRRVWDAGVTVALATDCNPGTSYVETMPFVVSLAVVTSGLTAEEAVWAATRGSALSLRRDDKGALMPGSAADMAILDAPSFTHLAYRPDGGLVARVIATGRPL